MYITLLFQIVQEYNIGLNINNLFLMMTTERKVGTIVYNIVMFAR
jgi:hypothetical protein